jgi:hypothetical protein
MIFLQGLIKILDAQNKYWRDNTIFLLDNPSIHKGKITKSFIEERTLPVCFTAPYSF